MSEPVTKDYLFSFTVPSGYRDARILAEDPWQRASTELLACRVVSDGTAGHVAGCVQYTVKGNKRSDIERKISNAARKAGGVEILDLEVSQA